MEDWITNTRIACMTPRFTWRGLRKDGVVVIGGRSWEEVGGEEKFVHDAAWRVAQDGASNKQAVIDADARLTRLAITEDFVRVPPNPGEPVPSIVEVPL